MLPQTAICVVLCLGQMVEIELRSLVCKNEFVNVDGYYNNDIFKDVLYKRTFFLSAVLLLDYLL